MTQLIMCLQCKLEDMNLIPHNSLFKKIGGWGDGSLDKLLFMQI